MHHFIRALFLCVGLSLLCSLNAVAQSNPTVCAPGMRFGSILNQLQINFEGRLTPGKMIATCLPDPVRVTNSAFPYNPDDGGKFSMTLKTSGGSPLTTYVWSVEKVSSLWELRDYKIVGGYEAAKPLVPGNYLLEFAIEDKPFYRFPFSVATKKSEDVYAPGTMYLLNGAWEEYGVFYYYKPDRYSQFLVWLRDTGKPRQQAVPVEMKLLRKSDNRLLAMTRPDNAVKLRATWNRFTLSFNPVTEDGQLTNAGEFHASEILKTDGVYVVRLALDGQLYGEYEFTVKGGQILMQGRQAREAATSMQQIEDVGNAWYLKRRAP
ncbi:MAG: hypothetical protein ACKV2V_13610 [Blastocatellia bacterium]